VQTALDASQASRPDFLVFCSQHGELARTRELLGAIVERGELSDARQQKSDTASGGYAHDQQRKIQRPRMCDGVR